MTRYFRITEKELMLMAGASGHLLAVQSCLKAHGEDGLAKLAGKHSTKINKTALTVIARDHDEQE